MSVTKKDVEYIAKLARLELTEKETENYTDQLNQILDYMEKLNELDTSNIEPLSHPVENFNVFREDIIQPSVSREDALKNAPDANEEFFKVPKVIKTD
ncbi:MAG: Asp-tRNA(Asn)/Glu-tRNA(Gln) amidotransferase subunit GatC [Melioribacteraceae bacterium]|nr:Asp-tRNA(Asn)/Glu-tRNA(Gln) amidotransferase subunit GatC [Melioribacteraceae bacterium]